MLLELAAANTTTSSLCWGIIGPQGTSICSRGPSVSRIPYKSEQFFWDILFVVNKLLVKNILRSFFYNTSFLTMSPLLLCISYHTYCTNVRAYVKWLILVVVLVLHLSIMCNPEESVEAKSFPFLKVRGWSYSIRTIHDSTKVDNFFETFCLL